MSGEGILFFGEWMLSGLSDAGGELDLVDLLLLSLASVDAATLDSKSESVLFEVSDTSVWMEG